MRDLRHALGIALLALVLTAQSIGALAVLHVTVFACDRGDYVSSDLQNIGATLRLFARHTGQLPTTEEGLGLLVPKYLEMVTDPWGEPYRYVRSGSTAWVRTLGRDRAPGGKDLDQDVIHEVSAADILSADAPTEAVSPDFRRHQGCH